MPEERTVSSFTWITGPLRSQMSVQQMAQRTQVRQHFLSETKVSERRPGQRRTC